VEDVRRSGEPAALTIIPPNSIPGYTSPRGSPTNFDQARSTLADAGFPQGKGFPTIEILFNTEGGHDLIAQAISRVWERELGIHVILQEKEIKVFRDDLKNGNFMIARGSWFGDYGDPTTFLNIYRKDDGNNDTKFSNDQFEKLMDDAELQPTESQRLELLSQAERLLVEEEFPNIPIFSYMNFYLFDPHRLTGISAHPRSEQQMWKVDLLGDGLGAELPITMHRASRSTP
jgi:oligopeptide transport system substrate-binding protein